MASYEMESFVLKFKNLQYADYKATLTIEAENGEAVVTLKACLGGLPPPPPAYQGHGHVPPVRRPPAYFRRQERQQKACDDVIKEVSSVPKVAEEAIDAKDVNKEMSSDCRNS